MRDLMIDIETLGNRPGSVILSIGAVAFDADTGEIGEEFYAAIDPETASKVGLTTDISTMLWWMKQSEAAREAAFSGKRSINMALTELSIFVKWQEPSRVWAKPPSFDLVMLEAAFRACDQDIPWHFRVHRDCRTIFDITGTKQPEVGTAHNALDDAKAQALGVTEAYRKLREPSPQMHVKPQPWKDRETFVFDLDGEMVDRLDALAESCEKQGVGVLASANYHGQGQVNVPAGWLRQLITGYRAALATEGKDR